MQPLAEAVIVAVEKREEFVDGKKKKKWLPGRTCDSGKRLNIHIFNQRNQQRAFL